jgi:hypothetical protein
MHRRSLGVALAFLFAAAPASRAQELSPAEKARMREIAADGLGVKGDGLHSPEESLDPKSIGPVTLRAAVLIGRLLHTTN